MYPPYSELPVTTLPFSHPAERENGRNANAILNLAQPPTPKAPRRSCTTIAAERVRQPTRWPMGVFSTSG